MMNGQGSPTRQTRHRLPEKFWWVSVLVCALFLFSIPVAYAAELECRLRLAWGGEAKTWEGTVQLSAGEIVSVTPLGLEADTAGSMQINAGTLRVFRRSPRSYDGCDLVLKTDDKAILSVEFSNGSDPARRVDIPVAKALKTLQSLPLDERGSRLLAQRSPGDSLRVELDRENLILAPAEKLSFRVQPHLADLPPSSAVIMHVQLTAARTEQELSAFQRELKTDPQGNVPAENIEIDAPLNEGAYDVRISLQAKRFGSALTPLTPAIVRPKPLAERRVQFMVVAAEAGKPRVGGGWHQELEIDPTTPRWWERLTRLPTLKSLPSFASGPVGNAKPGIRTHLNQSLVELAPDTWQAYPLTTKGIGEPHILEVEFPSDIAQTLSISLVEPNAAGQVVPLGLDSGIVVSEPGPGQVAKMEKHRLIFWPQTRSPLALLANRRSDRPAVYGKVRVLSGVTELEPLALPDAGQGRRKLTAYFDKPLIAEAFGGDETLDPLTKRNLDDWTTFHRGGRRMVEYLRHAGYSAAVIPAMCEGSLLYPSHVTESTPNYDNGIFFETAQDPVQKDALELFFRLFDRAGLELIPSLQLATPLTELEQLRLNDPAAAVGLEPIGPDGLSWLARNGSRRGQGVYYNPLDPRVQDAIRRLVQEVVERYGQHPSFAGLLLNLQPESYLLLPDEFASLDDVTIARFAREEGLSLPTLGPQRFAERAKLLRGEHQAAWLKWRALQLTKFQEQLQRQVQQQRPGAKLILAGGELFADRQVQQIARPTLPAKRPSVGPLMHLGLQPAAANSTHTPLFPRPERFAPNAPLGLSELLQQWNESAEIDAWFPRSSHVFLFHDPAPLRLASFDELSPFGKDKTHSWFVSHLSPSGTAARRRFVHSLAALDATHVFDGGWMPIFGQEETQRPWVEVYRQLPATTFQTHEPEAAQKNNTSVVVRSYSEGGQTWVYAVNDAPWPTTLELDVRSPMNSRWEPLGTLRGANVQPTPGGLRYATTLEPYDVVGAKIVGMGVKVEQWRSQPAVEVEPWLRDRLRDTRLRANSLRSPQPMNVLANASFEKPSANGIPHWTFAAGPGIRAGLDSTKAHDGKQSLRITSQAVGGNAPVVWTRSEHLATPPTGRLSLRAWMRIENPEMQPKLRLAVEGRRDGKPYYRFVNVGQSEDGGVVKPLTREWAAYRFPLNDLPLTGLTDLRVGIDLMGAGDVWIDNVQLFEFWLEDQERDELLKNIASAELQLDGQQFWECHRFLESPWPTFVRQFVTFDPARVATAPGKPPVAAENPAANKPGSSFNLNKWKEALPKWPLR